jgi:hypothetical protein
MAPIWPPDDQRQATENPDSMTPGSSGDETGSNRPSQGSPTLSSQPNSSAVSGPQLVAPKPPKPPSSIALWIDRLGLVIRVVFYIELGMLLTVLPWTRLWTDNSLVADLPRVRELLQMNFVRGLVTGVGLVDVWIGIWEAVRYREGK